jgi:hypothetical protein
LSTNHVGDERARRIFDGAALRAEGAIEECRNRIVYARASS